MPGSSTSQEQSYLASVLRRCSTHQEARRVHEMVLASNKHRQCTFLCNLLLSLYARLGDFVEAIRVFQSIEMPNIFSWNILLRVLCEENSFAEARSVFESLEERDVVTWTTMVSAYARVGHIDEAKSLFTAMPRRNEVSWNSMLACYIRCDDFFSSRGFFEAMPAWDLVAMNSMITATAFDVVAVKQLFDRMPVRDEISWTVLFEGYARHRDVDHATEVFLRMPHRDVVSWTNMFRLYVFYDRLDLAAETFESMPGKDTVAWNAMLGLYGDLSKATEMFDRIPKRDMSSWTTMSQLKAQLGSLEQAREMFDRAPQRDLTSWNAMICAYTQRGRILEAEKMFLEMPEKTSVSWTALFNALVKGGGMKQAREMFFSMDMPRDSAAWNAILPAFADHPGDPECGADSITEMLSAMRLEGHSPNEASFVAVLSVFADAGRVADSIDCFGSMIADHSVKPVKDHYCSLVDVLARCGRLEEAEELIHTMPMVPDNIAWASILAACKVHAAPDLAARAAHQLLNLKGHDSAPYSLLVGLPSTL